MWVKGRAMGWAAHLRYNSARRLLATATISRNWEGRRSRTLAYRCASVLVWYLAVSCTRSTAATQIVPSARRRDELLPEVRLASDVGQRLRRTANAIEQGSLLGVIEDEVGWPGFRLQVEINA